MSKNILRLGDPGSHGGVMTSSASNSLSEGILICRNGDIYSCPIHGPNGLISSSVVSIIEGKLIGLDGDTTECGASINATGNVFRSD